MNNYWEEEFFYDKDFNKMEDVAIAGDCVQQLTAIVMKQHFKGRYNQYAVYMNDISFNVSCDNENYITRSAVKSNGIRIERRAFSKNRVIVKKDLDRAMQAITEALKQFGYAVIRTVDSYLPFSIYWNEEFDMTKFQENGHFIMIISEDRDNYYFIDQLTEVIPDKFKHIPERKDIGICSKKVFAKALSLYVKVLTINFEEDNILGAEQFGNEILRISIRNYNNNIFTRITADEKVHIIGGQEAVNYFKWAYNEGKLLLDKKVYNPGIKDYCNVDIAKELMNGATGLKNRRMVLKGYFESSNTLPMDEALIAAINNSIDAWDKFKNVIIRKGYKKSYIFEEREEKYIRGVVNGEEEMFARLQEYCYKNGIL